MVQKGYKERRSLKSKTQTSVSIAREYIQRQQSILLQVHSSIAKQLPWSVALVSKYVEHLQNKHAGQQLLVHTEPTPGRPLQYSPRPDTPFAVLTET